MRSPEEVTALFRSTGRKVTPQRERIFRALHGNERHPTAEGVHAEFRSAHGSSMPCGLITTLMFLVRA